MSEKIELNKEELEKVAGGANKGRMIIIYYKTSLADKWTVYDYVFEKDLQTSYPNVSTEQACKNWCSAKGYLYDSWQYYV